MNGHTAKSSQWSALTRSLTSSGRCASPAAYARPGQNLREDPEYERNDTCSIFAVVESLTGRQHISVRERRTELNCVEEIQYLYDVMYPDAQKIIVVMDNLNTHAKSSLYKRFKPQEAHRLARRLEIHYTPKHGSWLDMAEIE